MTRRFQFSLRALLGLTALVAIIVVLIQAAVSDPRNSELYVIPAFAVAGIGGGIIFGSVARGIVFALAALCLLTAVAWILAFCSGLM